MDFVLQDDAYLHINRTATVAEQCFGTSSHLLHLSGNSSTARLSSSVFVNAFAFEGYDRDDLHLWNEGDRLIKTVASHCSNTVVVIHSPGPVLMESWVRSPSSADVSFSDADAPPAFSSPSFPLISCTTPT